MLAPFVFLLAYPALAQPLPGTRPLTAGGDLALQMVEGIDRYLMHETATHPPGRSTDRERFRKLIGVVDARLPFDTPSPDATLGRAARVASSGAYEVMRVRWPVFAGVDGEGLLLVPRRVPRAYVVALPDADWTPEMLAGVDPGVPEQSRFAAQLAASGCEVLVPFLMDRGDEFSGNARLNRFTNQPHREYIYRMAYEMGRHIIGYEVQKVLAAVDWFARRTPKAPVGVAGYGEGGLIAFYAAAADPRIDAALVSGYFRLRRGLWQEPIYRNVWALAAEFGSDAEIARLIAPRPLVIEASRQPDVRGPPPERQGRRGASPGRIATPDIDEVRAEVERARGYGVKATLVESATPGSSRALEALLEPFGVQLGASPPLKDERASYDQRARLERQFRQLVDFTQSLVRHGDAERRRFWRKADASSPEKWRDTSAPYRKYLWEEILGKLPPASEPLVAETRPIYDYPAFRGYEVRIPVLPDVFAYGVLLAPKDLKPGDRRAVVVTQHGLEGRPQDLVEPKTPNAANAYQRYAARLAERGYIVYAPQNPYIFGEQFRVLLRKANPLKLSLFSFILAQHARTLEWLGTLPFVDPVRIGFYGLSYGGKTAMRVPSLLDGYALSICSGDFNEWIWKITSVEEPFSYMFTHEYDMLEFDLGNTFNYFEMATLIFPRPFMVERGHNDGVGIDEWVTYEYARARRFYAKSGMPERTAIEFFNGPHQIHGVGTFEFLDRHLGR